MAKQGAKPEIFRVSPVTDDDRDSWRGILLENALDAVIGIDAYDTIVDWNKQAEKVFGWSKHEAIGKELAELIIPPEQIEAHQRGMARHMATGEGPILNRRVEMQALRRDGTRLTVELTVIPVFVKGKTLFFSFIRDISEQKRRRLEFERILESERRAREETDSARQRLLFLSDVARVLLADPLQFESLLRKAVQMLVPRVADWCVVDVLNEKGTLEQIILEHKDPEKMETARQISRLYPRRPRASAGVMHVFETGVPEFVENIGSEFLLKIAQDQSHLELLRSLNLRSYISVPLEARGKITGVLSLITEGSRQLGGDDLVLTKGVAYRLALALDNAALYERARKHAREAEQSASALREAITARDEFLSIASHELKTPLTTLKLQVHLAQRFLTTTSSSTVPRARFEKLVRNTDRQISRILHLVDDMLDVSRIANGRMQIEPEEVDLGAITKEVCERLEEQAAAAGSKLEKTTMGELVGYWDRFRIEQVISNLLTNAIKYGAGKPISIHVRRADDKVVLSVSDQGIGISSEDQDKIFQRFERAVSSANFSGFGLGLYISRYIVEGHGGRIFVTSELGKGSTFTVELPLDARS